ncbi:hypothetical protein C1I98_22525 [Spongiactinospora gelatinilytica]|uniref:Uncharacterized protein n=1 Tax=Spongiactinospora gelatinilytica TaxID=2666298 RepID=A0A2W2GTM2_9ACTN|nr:hypothetical protein [Spongiactinospora gelatinilytica]PZG40860.1 hypothetical protein C1I98_22525 [Spongiactinospora gelatinilytica]
MTQLGDLLRSPLNPLLVWDVVARGCGACGVTDDADAAEKAILDALEGFPAGRGRSVRLAVVRQDRLRVGGALGPGR